MKLLILALSMMTIGCTTPKIVGFDNDAQTVTLQLRGGETQEDAQEVADKYCSGHATLVSQQMKNIGANYMGYGMYSNTERPVLTFRCPKSQATALQ